MLDGHVIACKFDTILGFNHILFAVYASIIFPAAVCISFLLCLVFQRSNGDIELLICFAVRCSLGSDFPFS